MAILYRFYFFCFLLTYLYFKSVALKWEEYLETFLIVSSWGASTGVWWVEVKDAAKHITAHKAASTAKNYSVQNVSSADLRNPALNK